MTESSRRDHLDSPSAGRRRAPAAGSVRGRGIAAGVLCPLDRRM